MVQQGTLPDMSLCSSIPHCAFGTTSHTTLAPAMISTSTPPQQQQRPLHCPTNASDSAQQRPLGYEHNQPPIIHNDESTNRTTIAAVPSSIYRAEDSVGIIPIAIIGLLPTQPSPTVDDASSIDEDDSNFGLGHRRSFSLASGCGVLFSASLYNDVVSLKGTLHSGTPPLSPHLHLCEDSCGWVHHLCLLYTSDAADEEDSVDLGGRRIF
eukprot:TRINITY_DN9834_c0_g1_i2.p1 TRINITY_DN9834_c0_g1~~TRINITY_DN9834_c0_g1_i2.p1  ORF type:complete len:210 (-),score=16.60 TRINITY_DN9834_c0_g1_i2:77-706(-)